MKKTWVYKHAFDRVAKIVALTSLLVILTLVGSMMPYDMGGEGMVMKKIDIIRNVLSINNISDSINDFLPVNVGYDRTLVDAFDCYGIPVGSIAIVDREKLNNFFELIEGCEYRCIVIDLQFFEEDKTNADSSLFSVINRIPRLVIAQNAEGSNNSVLNPELLYPSEYGISLAEGNFVKFQFYHDNKPGLATKAFEIAYPNSRHNGLYMNNICLPLPFSVADGYNMENEKTYYNLGVDLLDVYKKNELAQFVKDKIIIVGDFVGGDNHDAYVGQISGPEIIINALIALKNGINIISPTVLIITFITYMLAIFIMIKGPLWLLPTKFGTFSLLRVASSFFNYTLLIFIMNLLLYLFTGIIYDLYFPLMLLTLLNLAIEYKLTKL